jgi:tRNA (guanine37-N1)-methyltransferase
VLRIAVISLFPEFVEQAVRVGVLGRAIERGLLSVSAVNPREFATDVHGSVDDRPYGGGPGMVLKPDLLRQAMGRAVERVGVRARRICLAADGTPLTQAGAARYARLPGLVLVAGRYEGIDERFIESDVEESVSVGDAVVSGGELPALMLIDAVARLLPGALGDAQSAQFESFADGLLDWPHYTRPEVWDGRAVPAVLLSGNHAAIERWRRKEALGRTWLRRPDLLAKRSLGGEEQRLLDEFRAEHDAAQEATRIEAGLPSETTG